MHFRDNNNKASIYFYLCLVLWVCFVFFLGKFSTEVIACIKKAKASSKDAKAPEARQVEILGFFLSPK